MMPRGCKWLNVDNGMAVARRLNLSAAPAMVGWHHGRGGSRPILDGVIVARENFSTLRDACLEDLKKKQKSAQEKKMKKAKENWMKIYEKVLAANIVKKLSDNTQETKKATETSKAKKAKKVSLTKSKGKGKEKATATTTHVHDFSIISEDKVTGITKKTCACGFSVFSEEL